MSDPVADHPTGRDRSHAPRLRARAPTSPANPRAKRYDGLSLASFMRLNRVLRARNARQLRQPPTLSGRALLRKYYPVGSKSVQPSN
jgi:hypothetical protein